MKDIEENKETVENENLIEDSSIEEIESPNYNYKWMIALLIVGIIGSFVFKYITK